jgi:hypothetical protein
VNGADEDDEANMEALGRQCDAFDRLFTVAMATAASVAAWLMHLALPEHPDGKLPVAAIGEYWDEGFHATVARQLQAATAVLTGRRQVFEKWMLWFAVLALAKQIMMKINKPYVTPCTSCKIRFSGKIWRLKCWLSD